MEINLLLIVWLIIFKQRYVKITIEVSLGVIQTAPILKKRLKGTVLAAGRKQHGEAQKITNQGDIIFLYIVQNAIL